MQIKSFLTEDEIRNHPDPLSFACHPFVKLKMVSTIIFNETCHVGSRPFEAFSSDDVGAIGEIIDDAADEIKFLVDVAQKQLSRLESRVRELEVRA